MNSNFILLLLIHIISLTVTKSSSETKPHGHKGVLPQFDGSILPLTLSPEQEKKLNDGEAVSAVTKSNGKAYVVQDIAADPSICMNFIKDVKNYDKYVKSVKKVTIYEQSKNMLGIEEMKATYDVAVFAIKFRYFMIMKYNPRLNTFTWTLDYSRNSDFDDNVGHWQVMKHPSKNGWTRVLYSCQVKLFSWVPGIVVNFLTKTALFEATAWVKKASEDAAKLQAIKNNKPWFTSKAKLDSLRTNILSKINEKRENDINFWREKSNLFQIKINKLFNKV